MIVNFNVCDHCGNQKQIVSGSTGLDVTFHIQTVYERIDSPHKFRTKDTNGTFCDKECFISYLKENLTNDGVIKVRKVDEF
jgi:hypothetical protein